MDRNRGRWSFSTVPPDHDQPLSRAGEAHVEHAGVVAAEVAALVVGEAEVALGCQQVVHA